MRWMLLLMLLSVPFVWGYADYADPINGFSTLSPITFAAGESSRSIALSVSDDAIYRTGYYSFGGSDHWTAFNFTQASTGGWIVSGQATVSLGVPASSSVDNYVLVYSCSRGLSWDCHGGQWQIRQFSTSASSFPDAATIIAVLASTDDGHVAANVFDGDFADESRWSGKGDGAWLQFELNQTALVDSVSVAAWDGSCYFLFDIEVSLDGSSWSQVYAGRSDGVAYNLETFSFAAVLARYVRIFGHGNTCQGAELWNSYLEVRIDDFSFAVDEPSCSPSCVGKVCGSDGCGGSCGSCGEGQSCSAGSCVPAGDGHIVVLYFNSFEQNALGDDVYGYGDDWYHCYGNDDAMISSDPDDAGNLVYWHHFPKGTWSLGNGEGSFCEYRTSLGRDELYFSYRIMFGPGFDPVHGGKMPALSGARSGVSAGTCPDGTDEFNAMMMFHGSPGSISPAFYLYYPDQWTNPFYMDLFYDLHGRYPTSCQEIIDDPEIGACYGASFYFDETLETGRWYTITIRLVANTPGVKNGVLEGFVDGRLSAQITGLRLRDIDSLVVNRLELLAFFGGSGEQYATSKEEDVYFDDFLLYYYTPEAGQISGTVPSELDRILPALVYPLSSPVKG